MGSTSFKTYIKTLRLYSANLDVLASLLLGGSLQSLVALEALEDGLGHLGSSSSGGSTGLATSLQTNQQKKGRKRKKERKSEVTK